MNLKRLSALLPLLQLLQQSDAAENAKSELEQRKLEASDMLDFRREELAANQAAQTNNATREDRRFQLEREAREADSLRNVVSQQAEQGFRLHQLLADKADKEGNALRDVSIHQANQGMQLYAQQQEAERAKALIEEQRKTALLSAALPTILTGQGDMGKLSALLRGADGVDDLMRQENEAKKALFQNQVQSIYKDADKTGWEGVEQALLAKQREIGLSQDDYNNMPWQQLLHTAAPTEPYVDRKTEREIARQNSFLSEHSLADKVLGMSSMLGDALGINLLEPKSPKLVAPLLEPDLAERSMIIKENADAVRNYLQQKQRIKDNPILGSILNLIN